MTASVSNDGIQGADDVKQAAHRACRCEEGVPGRRGRDARALGRAFFHRQGRIHFHLRAIGLRQVHAALDTRPARYADGRPLHAERHRGRGTRCERSCAHTKPRDRFHLPGVQSHRRSRCLRECRTAAHVSRRRIEIRAPHARAGSAGTRRHGAPAEALSLAALRRPAAARRRGARTCRAAIDPARRRTDRQSRFTQRRAGDGAA